MTTFLLNLIISFLASITPIFIYAVRKANGEFKVDYFLISNRNRFYASLFLLITINAGLSLSSDFVDILKLFGLQIGTVSSAFVGATIGALLISALESDKQNSK